MSGGWVRPNRPGNQNPPPVPAPRGTSNSESTPMEGKPPKYVSSIPSPVMNGYLEKATGDEARKNTLWTKKYVEVSDGFLKFFNSKNEREQGGIEVELAEALVSLYDKRQIRLESKGGVRLFRAASEVRALKWVTVISRYCSTPPTAEGYCMKQSGGKHCLEERYLRLSGEGIISWYKEEKEGASCNGAIQVRGEKIAVEADDPLVLEIKTTHRDFIFKFDHESITNLWYTACKWHSQHAPSSHTTIPVRNAAA